MNTTFRPHSKVAGFLGKLLSTSLVVCGLGIASTPVYAAATPVAVDQSPLIVQASLPPNITLMLDDSGSMDYDYMPDWSYLTNNSNDGVRNSANNGTYYNPNTTYSPPPNADGATFYPASPGLMNAYTDPFSGTGTTDITSYKDSSNGNYPYYTNLTLATSITYTPVCLASYNFQKVSGTYKCVWTGTGSKSNKDPTCPSGGTLKSSDQSICTVSGTKGFFTYTTGAANGPYTQHYVGTHIDTVAGDCSHLSSANKAVCDDSAATQQNVANWFSYYRKRILLAKSGVMSAFITVNPNYRVGFGSIGGSNTSNASLGSDYYPFTTSAGGNSWNTGIALVKPFDSTQKQKLWNWIAGTSPTSSTPLQQALDAVGQYYGTAQPWSTMSTDPNPTDNANKELACRQSYTILTTDGFWNGSNPQNVGDQDDTAGATIAGINGQKPYTYSPAVPYADTVNTKVVTNTVTNRTTGVTSNACDQTYQSTDGATDHDWSRTSGSGNSAKGTCKVYITTSTTVPDGGVSNTLADVAMKYWKTDLRTVPNEVPTSKEDPAFWQHMTTFTLGLGFTPTGIKPAGTAVQSIFDWANGGTAITSFSWPTPSSDSVNNIADLAHAAVNGHGGFYSATSPDSFTSGLKTALARASDRTGTGASLAANSTQLKAGTFAYQANYFTAEWNGDLKALKVDPNTGEIASDKDATWFAASQLTSATASTRNIWTYNPVAKTYVAFKNADASTPPALSDAQLTALASAKAGQVDMVNYLRGDASKVTANSYRSRVSPLGDIVDSQPVFVGAPDPDQFTGESNLTGKSAFTTYASTNSARTGLIYVAANDGMLHAFNADTGAEVYAYLPAAVIKDAKVASLADPNYGTDTLPHQYFNDGEMTVADAYFAEGADAVDWHTVLVGTTGRGSAKAIYALDVTDPSAIKFLWERSAGDGNTGDSNSGYIGQMSGKPVVAQTADGTWSVLMGNGYNSANGTAALLQFKLADGTLDIHATTDTSGLAAPAVWIDPAGNGVSTVAYAGDADGNVWSFAFQDSAGAASPHSAGTKLFVAKDSSNNPQPITAGMLAGKDAQTGNVWIFFGTGKYLATADLTDLKTQTWYGLIVQTTDSTNHPVVTSTMTRSANLAQRSITAETAGTPAVPADPTATPPTAAVNEVLPARTVTTAAAADALSTKSGWYIDLLSPTSSPDANGKVTYTPNATKEGERMVTPNQFQGNLLIGTTRIPQATDACNPSGRGWVMAIDPFTGTNPQTNFFDTNGDGVIDANDEVGGTPSAGVGFSSLPNNPIFVGGNMLTSFDNGTTSSLKTAGSSGDFQRVSWRELINQ